MLTVKQLTKMLDKILCRVKIVSSSDLSEQDISVLAEALVMRTALLSDLLMGSPVRDQIVDRWYRTLLSLETLEVEVYSEDWKTCREIITSPDFLGKYPDAGACRRAFKQLSKGSIHYKWILNAVLALIEGDNWFRRVNQFIVFDSKLNLTSLDLTTQCCEEYLDFEQSIPERGGWRTPDGKGHRLLNVAKRAASDMVGGFNIRDYPFRPSHGNGATAEVPRGVADTWHKNRCFTVDSEVIHYLRYRVPEDDWRSWFYVPYKGLDRTAQVVCVPKGMTSNRTISKEPTTLQYLQQDIARALDDYFVEHLSAYIDLHDQTRSRVLAQAGSSDGSYATIDLSSASDSVTCDLLDTLFDGLPIWYPLMATRSTFVHVRSKGGIIDTTIEAKKFAPMGSSTCFPTECIVFAIMAEVAVRSISGRRSRGGDFVVYGDDIVIRSRYAEELVEILEFFGFTVNRSKSFYDTEATYQAAGGVEPSRFREACGIECLNGCDITPLRLSRRLVSLTNNDSTRLAGQGVGMIDLVNRSYLFHYTLLRRWLVTILDRYKWFRTSQYLAISDYRDFAAAIRDRRQPSVHVCAPFIITDDGCDTNYRAFGSRHKMFVENMEAKVNAYQEPEAEVSTVVPRKAYRPYVTMSRTFLRTYKRENKGHRPLAGRTMGSANDYFTWNVRSVARPSDQLFELDAQGIVTIRTRDLKWSTKWAILTRRARLSSG